MEYCSHIWGGAPQSGCLDSLDRVQRRLVNLIEPVLSSTLQPLYHRRVVASLSLFYKYYRFQDLSSLVPHRRLSVRLTRFSESFHQYAVDTPRCKRNSYQTSLFSTHCRALEFPLCRVLSIRIQFYVFKGRVNRFLLLLH